MKELILLRGIPGCGKSTVAQILQELGAFTISADDFQMEDGVYAWKPERLGYAHSKCQFAVEFQMKFDFPVIAVHNTFTTDKEMEEYFKLANEYGYKVTTMIVENRHGGKNIHDVPTETLDKMEKRFSIKLR